MKTVKYIVGNYPTTMQAICNEFIPEEYEEIKKEYNSKFNLNENFKFQEYNQNYQYYLNFSAYLILDKSENKILDYGFEEFNDFVWILKIINKPLEFKMPKKVLNTLHEELKYCEGMLEITE